LLGFFSLLTAIKLMSMSLEPYQNSLLQPVGLICVIFGLVNQLSKFLSSITSLLAFLRSLRSKNNELLWMQDVDQVFFNAKRNLTSAPILAYFDLKKPTRLCTDASRQGLLGFAFQQLSDNDWVLGQAGFHFISETVSLWAWAILKCKNFLAGLSHFKIVTDDQPLVSILNHLLDEIENS